MIAPRLMVRYRDHAFAIVQQGEAWVIQVGGAEYFLTLNDDPDRATDRFLLDRLRGLTAADYDHPSLIASERHPMMLMVDGIQVRAWPALVPRGRGARTYQNPATGDRVATTRGPVWMFAAKGRAPSEGGTTNYQQTVDDVVDMAKLWLRAADR
jgi:hypothetical protein